jgi:lysophospholipid hydrolase
MGKHAFSRMGKLKLMSWLAEQEEKARIVLYLADSGVTSQWTRTCIRQADCILLVGLGDGDPSVGEYERFLINMKTTARKELVLLHGEKYCASGTTQEWLKVRNLLFERDRARRIRDTDNSILRTVFGSKHIIIFLCPCVSIWN